MQPLDMYPFKRETYNFSHFHPLKREETQLLTQLFSFSRLLWPLCILSSSVEARLQGSREDLCDETILRSLLNSLPNFIPDLNPSFSFPFPITFPLLSIYSPLYFYISNPSLWPFIFLLLTFFNPCSLFICCFLPPLYSHHPFLNFLSLSFFLYFFLTSFHTLLLFSIH